MSRDRISGLPDCLITHILSYLPTTETVKTSVLSKRWEFLWLKVPVLDLKVNDFPDYPVEVFPGFIDNFLQFNHESRMQKFKIKYDEFNTYRDRFVEWIGTAVDRGIQHLDVHNHMHPCLRDYMPQNIYKSNTLVSLKLHTVGFYNPEFVVSLPCLKILYLEDIWFDDDPLIMEKFISGCPVLEDLTLIRPSDYYDLNTPLFLRVKSQTLRRFHYTFEHYGTGGTDFSLDIDTPALEYLSFKDDQSDTIVIKNLTSLFMIDIDTEFNVNVKFGGTPLEHESFTKRDTIRDFLIGISSVRHMTISYRTLKVLYQYSKMLPIPKFSNLDHLHVEFCCSMLQQLMPVFLESCPNLKNLIMDWAVSTKTEHIELSYVPGCLSSSLECVEIKGLILEEEMWKKLARYFLENSAVLKKLVLNFSELVSPRQESDIFKELRTYSKLSRRCQVFVDDQWWNLCHEPM